MPTECSATWDLLTHVKALFEYFSRKHDWVRSVCITLVLPSVGVLYAFNILKSKPCCRKQHLVCSQTDRLFAVEFGLSYIKVHLHIFLSSTSAL